MSVRLCLCMPVNVYVYIDLVHLSLWCLIFPVFVFLLDD